MIRDAYANLLANAQGRWPEIITAYIHTFSLTTFITLSIAVLVASLMPTLISFLQRKAMLDIPNERSSHTVPTPRGGGLLALGLPWLGFSLYLLLTAQSHLSLYALSASLLLLMIVSAMDDRHNLPQTVRLLAQLAAASIVVFCLPQGVRVLPVLPHFIEQIALILGLIWMMNLTNFIDGIDGITCVNGLTTVLGFTLISLIAPVHMMGIAFVSGGLLGFLYWNRPPAKIFMGDVGSVALGLWLGYMAIVLSSLFGLIPVLLCVLYPLLDATYTLAKRGLQRKKIWQAHREHFYQQATQNGRTHGRVISMIFVFNMICIGLAYLSVILPQYEFPFLILGVSGFALLARKFSMRPS